MISCVVTGFDQDGREVLCQAIHTRVDQGRVIDALRQRGPITRLICALELGDSVVNGAEATLLAMHSGMESPLIVVTAAASLMQTAGAGSIEIRLRSPHTCPVSAGIEGFWQRWVEQIGDSAAMSALTFSYRGLNAPKGAA